MFRPSDHSPDRSQGCAIRVPDRAREVARAALGAAAVPSHAAVADALDLAARVGPVGPSATRVRWVRALCGTGWVPAPQHLEYFGSLPAARFALSDRSTAGPSFRADTAGVGGPLSAVTLLAAAEVWASVHGPYRAARRTQRLGDLSVLPLMGRTPPANPDGGQICGRRHVPEPESGLVTLAVALLTVVDHNEPGDDTAVRSLRALRARRVSAAAVALSCSANAESRFVELAAAADSYVPSGYVPGYAPVWDIADEQFVDELCDTLELALMGLSESVPRCGAPRAAVAVAQAMAGLSALSLPGSVSSDAAVAALAACEVMMSVHGPYRSLTGVPEVADVALFP